jgi:hypothetical protein
MSCVSIYRYLTCWLFLLLTLLPVVDGWQVVLVGGTGPIGQRVATLLPHHDVIILTRNAFLAGAPSRVSHDTQKFSLDTITFHQGNYSAKEL